MTASINQRSIDKYRARAAGYDATTARTRALRLRTIGHLALAPGDVVLDVGCGTGLSFEPLLERVGATGTVVGVDQSPEMAAQAIDRVRRHGWPNATVVVDAIEHFQWPGRFDAILFNYAHDITRSPESIDNVFRHASSGARVAMAGMKLFPWWTGPLNLLALAKNWGWNGSVSGMWQPWDLVQRHVPDLVVEPTQFGMGYIAYGRFTGGRTQAGTEVR